MDRGLTSAMNTALTGSVVEPAFLAKFEFPDGDLRLWTGSSAITYNAESYTGLGNLIGVSMPKETSDGSASGVTFSISGIPSSHISLALSNTYQNAPCYLWFACMATSSTFVADPYLMFSGLMDVAELSDDGETATISVKAEGFAYGVGPSSERRTDQDQREKYSSDRSLRFIADLQNKEFTWGAKI